MSLPRGEKLHIAIPNYLKKIRPYVAGRPIEEVQKQYGIKSVIKLASNENPLGPSPKAIEAIKAALEQIHLYPDSSYQELRQRLADKLNVSWEQIVIGNGSDEVMAFIGQALLLPQEEIVIPHPAFSIYEKVGIMAQAVIKKVPLKNMSLDLKAIKEAISSKTKLVFLTNPHNPTGSFIEKKELVDFLSNIPSSSLVVLDEAYIDFVSPQRRFDSTELISKFPNLMVLRTFSKSYGLAGLRIGYGVFSKELASLVDKVRLPFNVNVLAVKAAMAALEDDDFLQETQILVEQGRHILSTELQKLGIKVYPSEANFIMIEVGPKAREIYQSLLKIGIIIRPLDNYDLPQCLRISVGTPYQNRQFLDAFKIVWESLS